MRVAVLDHTAALGGAELALVRLLDAVEPTNAQVTTVLFTDGPLRELLEERGHAAAVVPLDPRLAMAERHAVGTLVSGFRSAIAVAPFVLRLARTLRDLDVDVVHTTSLKADLIGVPAALLARRPLVWHVHDRISPDYLPRPMVALIRGLARFAPRHVVVNSRATAATLPGARRLTVAYPGLAPEQIRRLGPTTAPPRSRRPGHPTVGILGRISPTKGQLVFVRAAAQIRQTHPDVRFRILGAALFTEQDYEQRVRDEIAALGLSEVIEMVGFAQDPASELDDLDVVVHASPTPEPFGQVVAEAMARGVPVVATRGGGVTEIVHPADAAEPLGALVPPDDPRALAAAIRDVLDHPEDAARRARTAWAYVHDSFPIERTARTITQVWQSVARAR